MATLGGLGPLLQSSGSIPSLLSPEKVRGDFSSSFVILFPHLRRAGGIGVLGPLWAVNVQLGAVDPKHRSA
jgi:hypothetical protein